jgi:hypothetical protein
MNLKPAPYIPACAGVACGILSAVQVREEQTVDVDVRKEQIETQTDGETRARDRADYDQS